MASSGFSSSSSSAPAKSSQPLHNFELPRMLRWNNREGQHSGGSHRRWRSMKPAPQRPNSPLRRSPPPPRAPRFETPIREFSAPPAPRHQSHPARESWVDRGNIREPVFNHELERLSLMREEVIRNYRVRDWWSESGQSDAIAYRRNPHRRSGFSPWPANQRLGANYPDGGRRYDADRGFDVYHRRNAYRRSSLSGCDAYNNNRSPSPFRRPGFDLDSEENRSPAFHRKSGFSSPSNHHPFSQSSHSYPRNSDYRKTGLSSPKRRSLSWNSGERKVKMGEDGASSYPQYHYPDFKGSGFSSEANEKAKVAEAEAHDSSSKLPLEKSAGAAHVSNQNPKVSPNKEERKKEGKSKANAESPRNNNVSSNSAAAEEKKDKAEIKGKGKDKEENPVDEEDIKVWNLRPRNVKSNNKDKDKGKSKPAGEKKQEKRKLSIEISLTKQEIEEDIYALTGAKPSRRPKKRQKNVQKQLDSVFPGLWLQNITPESYKVSENSLKYG